MMQSKTRALLHMMILVYHFSMQNRKSGGIALAENFSIREISLFRAGGIAELYAEPRTTEELLSIMELASEKGLNIEVIGAGSHILAPESGIPGLLVSTRSMKGITIRGDLLTAGPGEMLDGIINIAIDHKLIGLEELGGIPGTIAGALSINASANGRSISDAFFYADYVTPDGRIHRRTFYPDTFSLQDSAFSPDEIIVNVALRLKHSKATAEARLRKEKFVELMFIPPCRRCAGEVFRDLPDRKAADLIRQAGFIRDKDIRAEFSDYQSNCIFTYDGCTSDEIFTLILRTAEKVHKETGVLLEPSITLLGSFKEQWKELYRQSHQKKV